MTDTYIVWVGKGPALPPKSEDVALVSAENAEAAVYLVEKEFEERGHETMGYQFRSLGTLGDQERNPVLVSELDHTDEQEHRVI